MAQQRRHYRIKYPAGQRPRMLIEDQELEVIEVSEGGARIATEIDPPERWQSPFPVTIVFKTGTQSTTQAVLIRQEPGQVVLRFTSGIPFSMIMAEQRRLADLFPREARRKDDAEEGASF